MRFGERLKIARKEKNLTQDEVAKKFHVLRQTISSWENERTYPDFNSLIKLSDFYSLSLDTLLKEDKGMKENLIKKDYVNKSNLIILLLSIIMVTCLFALDYALNHLDNIIFAMFILFIEVINLIVITLIRKDRKKFNLNTDVIKETKYYGESKLLKWLSFNIIFISFIILEIVVFCNTGFDNLLKDIMLFISLGIFLGMIIYSTIKILKQK